jgi:hypothetical protein
MKIGIGSSARHRAVQEKTIAVFKSKFVYRLEGKNEKNGIFGRFCFFDGFFVCPKCKRF